MSTTNITNLLNKISLGGHYISRTGHSGDGLGNFKESLLGVEENNSSGPDLPDLELKVMKEDSDCLLTLKCKSPTINLIAPHPGFTKKGKVRAQESYAVSMMNKHCIVSDGRKDYKFDMRVGKVTEFDGDSYMITRDDENFWVLTLQAGLWVKEVGLPISVLMEDDFSKPKKPYYGMETKCGSVLLSRGKAIFVEDLDDKTQKMTGSFSKATHFSGFSRAKFLEAFDAGKVIVSMRVHSADTLSPKKRLRVGHDHGFAFRMAVRHVPLIYDNVEEHEITPANNNADTALAA